MSPFLSGNCEKVGSIQKSALPFEYRTAPRKSLKICRLIELGRLRGRPPPSSSSLSQYGVYLFVLLCTWAGVGCKRQTEVMDHPLWPARRTGSSSQNAVVFR